MSIDAEIMPLNRGALESLLHGKPLAALDDDERARRASRRWPFQSPVEMWVPEGNGYEHHLLGTCYNLSSTGMGVVSEESLIPGMELNMAVHQPEVTFHGRAVVKHCSVVDVDTFLIGMQFLYEDRA